jgi:glutamate dehydrogenase/leucine dehydrogenase
MDIEWEETEVNDCLKTIMDREVNSIFELAGEKQASLRTAAYLVACSVSQVLLARKEHGSILGI